MACEKCRFPKGIEIKPNGVDLLDPCKYRVSEIHTNVTVEVSKCTCCGSVDISWHRQDNTEDIYYSEQEE